MLCKNIKENKKYALKVTILNFINKLKFFKIFKKQNWQALKESKDARREIEFQIKASIDCEYIVKIKDVYFNKDYYYVYDFWQNKNINKIKLLIKIYLFILS